MIKEKFQVGLPNDAKVIRQEVFVEEQGFKEEFSSEDNNAIHLVLYLDNYPIATARLIEEDPETYHVGRVAVRKPYRGKKIGTYLMKFLEVKARTLGARKLVLNAQLDKKDFYLKCGYKEIDGEIFLDEGCPHIALEKQIVKKPYYRKKSNY
jgi:predicted GNAT family N-acyltransferase